MLYRLGCQKGGLVILGVHSNDLSNNALLTQGECMHQNSFRMQTLAADTVHAGFSLLVSCRCGCSSVCLRHCWSLLISVKLCPKGQLQRNLAVQVVWGGRV